MGKPEIDKWKGYPPVSSEDALKYFFETSTDLLFVQTIRGYFIRVNPAWETVLGYSAEEITNMRFPDFIHPADLDKAWAEFNQLEEGNRVINFECRHVCKDGGVRVIAWASHISLEKGIIYGIGRDLTEQKAMQLEMLRMDRLNLAGEMAAALSHELRNPMTTVRGYLQLMKLRGGSANLDDLELMISELDDANAIITELLNLAKNKLADKQLINLSSIVMKLTPLIEADAFLSGIKISVMAPPVPQLWLDEKEIRQMILNLARNGMEAMQPGGMLSICSCQQEQDVLLKVTNDGPPIDEEVLGRLGTPFFSTKNMGVGLGLPICYRIADRHNARITVETGLTGTTFTVRFTSPQNE